MIAIVGAGISGLSIAWHLHQKNIPYQIFESSSEVGGYLKTVQMGKNKAYLFEKGANSLLMDDEIFDFIQKSGFEKDLIYANKISKSRFIVRDGKQKNYLLPHKDCYLVLFFPQKQKLKFLKNYLLKKKN